MKLAGLILAAAALAAAAPADAAEVKVIASTAIKTALEALAPQFEAATEHKLAISYGASARLVPEIEKGRAFDIAILSASVTDALVNSGKLVAATRIVVARSGAGVAIRQGTPRPDIGTVDAFRHTLLATRSIRRSLRTEISS